MYKNGGMLGDLFRMTPLLWNHFLSIMGLTDPFIESTGFYISPWLLIISSFNVRGRIMFFKVIKLCCNSGGRIIMSNTGLMISC